jgi:hypothetical protein
MRRQHQRTGTAKHAFRRGDCRDGHDAGLLEGLDAGAAVDGPDGPRRARQRDTARHLAADSEAEAVAIAPELLQGAFATGATLVKNIAHQVRQSAIRVDGGAQRLGIWKCGEKPPDSTARLGVVVPMRGHGTGRQR